MSDSDLAPHYQDAKRRDIDQKLKSIFGKELNEISTDELSTFVQNFNQRIYLFKNSIPKNLTHVLTGVLTHKNLSDTDRQVNFNILPPNPEMNF